MRWSEQWPGWWAGRWLSQRPQLRPRLLTCGSLPCGQPARDLEPLVPELGDTLHDDVVLCAGPRGALLLVPRRALLLLRRALPVYFLVWRPRLPRRPVAGAAAAAAAAANTRGSEARGAFRVGLLLLGGAHRLLQSAPPVAHGVVRSAGQLRGNHAPLAAQHLHAMAYEIVLCHAPLLARERRHLRPALASVCQVVVLAAGGDRRGDRSLVVHAARVTWMGPNALPLGLLLLLGCSWHLAIASAGAVAVRDRWFIAVFTRTAQPQQHAGSASMIVRGRSSNRHRRASTWSSSLRTDLDNDAT